VNSKQTVTLAVDQSGAGLIFIALSKRNTMGEKGIAVNFVDRSRRRSSDIHMF
jgi:hypothetical protein